MTTFYTVVNWLVILGYWLLIAGVTLRIFNETPCGAVRHGMVANYIYPCRWWELSPIFPLENCILANGAPSARAPCGPSTAKWLTDLKKLQAYLCARKIARLPNRCSNSVNVAGDRRR